MSRLREALDQVDFTRRYTRERIDTVPPSEWFTIPPNGVSHVAWQVGHLAVTEYRICLARLRPRTAEDESLLPIDSFMKLFGAGSNPGPATDYPPAAEIRSAFDRVHARVMEELSAYPDADLDLEILIPHALFTTRIASLRYAPLHEMIHCGQIAMLRRTLGQKPVW
jgi:hypothetical protein